jgi:hypothetical protein
MRIAALHEREDKPQIGRPSQTIAQAVGDLLWSFTVCADGRGEEERPTVLDTWRAQRGMRG